MVGRGVDQKPGACLWTCWRANTRRLAGIMWCFVVLTVICTQSDLVVSSLQCYTCTAEDTNDNCNINEAPVLTTCPARGDRCLTQVIYSSERGKLRIDKSCASQDGCDAATEQLGKRYFCDKSRAGWGCVECCDTDKCNVNGVSRQRISTVALIGALCLVAMVSR